MRLIAKTVETKKEDLFSGFKLPDYFSQAIEMVRGLKSIYDSELLNKWTRRKESWGDDGLSLC